MQFHQPEAELPELTCRVEVRRGQGGDVVKEQTVFPHWTEGRFVAVCDLADHPPGAYQVTASLQSGGKLFDRTTRLVGRQAPKTDAETMDPAIVNSVPSCQAMIGRDKPIFGLTPTLPDDDGSRHNHLLAWEKHYKPFLDHAAELSREISLQVPWKDVEPLTGLSLTAPARRLWVVMNSGQPAGLIFWPSTATSPRPKMVLSTATASTAFLPMRKVVGQLAIMELRIEAPTATSTPTGLLTMVQRSIRPYSIAATPVLAISILAPTAHFLTACMIVLTGPEFPSPADSAVRPSTSTEPVWLFT